MLGQNHGTMADFLSLLDAELIPFFQNLAVKSPYIDTRAPQVADTPEERRYQAAYLDADLITTLRSETLVVTAQG